MKCAVRLATNAQKQCFQIELSVVTKQCLSRRISSLEKLNVELSAWEKSRNDSSKHIDWHFTTEQARGKLKHLYPNL